MKYTPEEKGAGLEYWLRHFGMPEENIEKCVTQIAQGYGACRYLEGVQIGAEAVNELAEQEHPSFPSNLDEAADKATGEYVYNEGGPFSGTTGVSFLAGFKAGAEWMAEQGGTIECSIDWYDGPIPDCSEEQLFSAIEKAELEVGDKVIIQIRKK